MVACRKQITVNMCEHIIFPKCLGRMHLTREDVEKTWKNDHVNVCIWMRQGYW